MPAAPSVEEVTSPAEILQIVAVVAALIAENDHSTCLAFVNGILCAFISTLLRKTSALFLIAVDQPCLLASLIIHVDSESLFPRWMLKISTALLYTKAFKGPCKLVSLLQLMHAMP